MLIDTSSLLRTLQLQHPQFETARTAIKTLATQGHSLHIVPQILIELWVVATRPGDRNGLGLTPNSAAVELAGRDLLRFRTEEGMLVFCSSHIGGVYYFDAGEPGKPERS